MSDTKYIPAKHFRELTEFTVESVYPFYRNGGIMKDGKFQGKTFKYEDGSLLEEVWTQDSDGKWSSRLEEPTVPINREFFQTYKKVFDIKVSTAKPVTIGGETSDSFVIKRLGAFKIKEMLREDLTIEIPMSADGENEEFDWEDELYKKLEGKTYQMKVTGQMLKTKYKFKLIGELEPVEQFQDDLAASPQPEDLPF